MTPPFGPPWEHDRHRGDLEKARRHVDIFVAVAVTALALLWAIFGKEEGAEGADAFSCLLVISSGTALLYRRRWPVEVLSATLAISIVYHWVGYHGGPPVPAVWVALYTTASLGHRAVALIVAFFFLATSISYRVIVEDEGWLPVLVPETSITAAAIFLGEAVNNRRAYFAEVRERMRRAEHQREAEAEQRLVEERMRIARDLHDVVAHTIAVISVQADVASEVIEDSPEQAKAALATIRDASRSAMEELRATVGVLRSGAAVDAPPRSPAPTVSDVGSLVEQARATGLEVTCDMTGERRDLPSAVGLALFRIVQESLTNVIRHAGATRVDVKIHYAPGVVEVEVSDDGRGPGGAPVGHGIVGMKERALSLGGVLEAGSGLHGGFCVRATLPTERSYA
jgi:signal transduction histidine kinase